MLTNNLRRIPVICMVIALVLHLFIFLGFTLTWHSTPSDQPTPDSYVPAYVQEHLPALLPVTSENQANFSKPLDKQGLAQPKKQAATPVIPTNSELKKTVFTKHRETVAEEVNLIGNKKMDAPLLKLLGKALSAHLSYPKPAIDFNLKGLVTVGFMLHPDGNITDIKLVGSSSAGVLDQASLLALHAITPVAGVAPLLKEPTYLVVGFMFG
jgi:TonB family protein